MNILTTIAQSLNDSEYPLKVTPELEQLAKENGIVIVFGASDDLIEFRGLFSDEAGVYDGGTVFIDKDGVLPINEDGTLHDDEPSTNTVEECRKIVQRFDSSIKVEAIWCPDNGTGCSWDYVIPDNLEKEPFNVVEDGQLYCVGYVFKFPSNAVQEP